MSDPFLYSDIMAPWEGWLELQENGPPMKQVIILAL